MFVIQRGKVRYQEVRGYLLADPNGFGCDPKGVPPPPKPPKPPPAGEDDAKEPNPPPCAADPNPLEAPKVPDDPPKVAPPPPNPVLLPVPIGAGDPNVAAPVAGAAAGCCALTPNMDGSRLYFLARLRNNSVSLPLYLVKTLSTSCNLLGFLL